MMKWYLLSYISQSTFAPIRGFLAIVTVAAALFGQRLDNSALTGRYRLVRLEFQSAGEATPKSRNLIAAVTFDGAGGYTLSTDVGGDGSAPATISGTYDVATDGSIALDDPSRPGGKIDGALSVDRMVLTGVALGAEAGFIDLVVAVREAESPDSQLLQGAYTVGGFQVPGGDPDEASSVLFSFQSDGMGRLDEVQGITHRRGSRNAFQPSSAGAYQLAENRTFTAELQGVVQTPGGLRLFVSADGNYVVGAPMDGSPGIFSGIRELDGGLPEGFVGLYQMANIGFDGAAFHAGVGTAVLRRGTDALIARRLRVPSGTLDLSRRDSFVWDDNGAGWLSPDPYSGGHNMTLGVADSIFGANGGVGAGVDAVGQLSDDLGMFLLLRPALPDVTAGLFADYRSVVHGASFARPPNPLAPGLLATIFGADLIEPDGPDTAAATEAPLPVELARVQVTVDGVPAPLVFVSRAQINFQVPTETRPGIALITISNGNEEIEVLRRVASTSPGLFFGSEARSAFAAIASHADGSLVTPAAPARPGETVVFWTTGFGVTQPMVASGAPNPGLGGEGLAIPVDPNISLLVAGLRADILFIGGTPGFVGLTQINATIPRDAALGDTVPIALVTSNAIHDQADLAIGGAPVLTEERTGNSGPDRTFNNHVRQSWRER